jgi:hypothetical protein
MISIIRAGTLTAFHMECISPRGSGWQHVSEQDNAPAARSYRMRKRAEDVAATRRRIVEAAVHLHGTIGPAATTISALADQAGVTRSMRWPARAP